MPSLYQAQFRHAQHYEAQLKTAHNLSAQGREGVLQGLQLFEQEQQHILMALTWTGSQATSDDEAAKICQQMLAAGDSFLMLRQHPSERIRLIKMGVVAAQRLKQPASESFYLNALSSLHFTLGDYEEAQSRGAEALSVGFELQGLEEALQLCGFSDPYIQASESLSETERMDAFYKLFDLLHRKTGLAGAGLQYADDEAAADLARREIDHASASAQRFSQSGDKAGEAKALANLASGYAKLGEYRLAIEKHQHALKISRELGDQRSCAVIQGILGWLYAAVGETPVSVELLKESLDIYRKIEDRRGEDLALSGLGAVHAIRGDRDRAHDFFRQALEPARALKDATAQSFILSHVSLSLESLGDYDQSLAAAKESARLLEQRDPQTAAALIKLLEQEQGRETGYHQTGIAPE